MGIASLVLGIVSITFAIISWGCLWWLSLIIGIVGLVLGILDIKKKKVAGEAYGMAKAGFICSIVGIVISILLVMFVIGITSLSI